MALSLALACVFALFIFVAAFNPALFGGPVFAGGTVSVWFAFAIGLIWATVLLVGLYVVWANAQEAKK